MLEQKGIPKPLLWTLAVACALSVANLYYNQPLLDEIRRTYGASVATIGLVPTFTQLGYALGMLFLIPLGDMFERKRLIVGSAILAAGATALMAIAPTVHLLIGASLLVGLTTMTPQLIIPFAAHLASDRERGAVVGTVMSGLLIGILLGRTVSGIIGAALGWRAMFWIASGILLVTAAFLAIILPKNEPTFRGSYAALFRSLGALIREFRVLRISAVIGAALFGAFSAFWATLVFLLQSPWFNHGAGYGARVVGFFGLLGAAGALAAPLVGRAADQRGARFTVGVGLAVTALSFVILFLSGHSIPGLILGVLVMDAGVQTGHVSNQSRIFALSPSARSRVNTVYMFSYFVGGSLGSSLGSTAWTRAGWTGVCLTALCIVAVGGATFLWERRSA